uniref:CDP-diacylglycerol--glycerol-3-phosphate 3-phosphatidyltransferase n=1 Tax=Ascaris lumbricoides TaxID=6252 RepID=A0A9J2PJ82_ASCLU
MDDIQDLTDGLRSVAIDADCVKIIETPQQFYEILIKLTRGAKERVILSTLYLGNGTLERKLVNELEEALIRCPELRMNILIDYLRGTREGEKSSAAILKRLTPRAAVYLFHTPHLRGLLKRFLPERTNEIVGLQHMKLYIFDDNVLISGANLSDSYFTCRQDRYVLIEGSRQLAGFFERLVDAVSSCSYILKSDGSIEVDPRCDVHPYREKLCDYAALIRARVLNVLDSLPSAKPFSVDGTSDSDTRVYPLVQMGMFSVNQENDFLTQLFSSQDNSSTLTLTSGYFNFVDDYGCLISKTGKYAMNILFASPQANGFYNGSGLSGYVPSLYVVVSELFFRTMRSEVRMFEYTRPGWTYHAKGLWIESSKSPLSATLVGSSNYGYRSVHRDLEAQLLIVTSNEHLKNRLKSEHSRLMEWSSIVEASTFLRPNHAVPRWQALGKLTIRYTLLSLERDKCEIPIPYCTVEQCSSPAMFTCAMVLLQGLVFGRVLMDAIGRRGSQRALATTSSLGSYSSQKRPHKRRVRRTEPINPFLTEECLHRIGGSSIRCISTRHEPTVQEILNDETWVAVYRFPGIRIGVLLARAKLLQTMASVMLVPYTYWQYLNEAVTLHFLGGVTMLAVVATSMLMLFSRQSFFYLPTKNVEIVDEERANLLFGDVSIFNRSKKND